MKELLSKIGIDVTELAKRFGVSRPSVYRYLECYDNDDLVSIPSGIRAFFDFVTEDENRSFDRAMGYLVDNFPTGCEAEAVEDGRIIESIVSKFCDDKQTGCNFLSLVLPTGSRKTSSVVRFIANYVAEGGTKRIFFITTLKKNLPSNAEEPAEDALRSAFVDAGIGSLYDERVMIVDSLADMLLSNYPVLPAIEKRNCLAAMGDKAVSELNGYLSSLKEVGRSTKAYKGILEDFRGFESRFRRDIARRLNQISRDPSEKKRLVTEDRRWSWVSKIYPTVFTEERQVFLMSVAKFVSTHDTIVGGRYSIYDSELIDGSYIFIDEFDATKEAILGRIIDADKGDVDYIGIFRRIFRTLEHDADIWKEYYRLPDGDDPSTRDPAEDVLAIRDSSRLLADMYHLECDFKLADAEPRTYIFRDNRIIRTGESIDFVIEYDEEQRINIIRSACPDEERANLLSLPSMLGRMYGLFRHFESTLYMLAWNHCRVQEEKGKPIPFDSAIRTMLDPYDFNESQVRYLLNAVKFRPPKRRNARDSTPDVSFYESGFEFFNIIDSDDHNLSTKLYCTSIKRTPEKMLMMTLSGSHGARVIGISATARLRTVVGNYDFRYLKAQEDFREYHIGGTDREGLRRMFARTVDRYDRVTIETGLIDGGTPMKDLIDDRAFAADLEERLDAIEKGYVRDRYVRVFTAYRRFLDAEDARSMLCFLNIFPRSKGAPGSEDFDEDLIRKVFSRMLDEHCERLQSKGWAVPDHVMRMKGEPFTVMGSVDFDARKEALLSRLSKGDKVFVMTTYATVGAGQNLQYRIPTDVLPDIRSICSSARVSRGDSKDFDAIYLDMPTNVATIVRDGDKETLLESLFDIESLQENHEIDVSDARTDIEASFSSYYGGLRRRSGKAMDRSSYRMAYARRVIQAVGRICRTPFKNSTIRILADDTLGKVFRGTSVRDFIDPDEWDADLEDAMINPEFRALLDRLQESSCDYTRRSRNAMIDNESLKTKAYVDAMLRRLVWTPGTMRSWKSIREFVLRFPTAPGDTRSELVYNMYHHSDIPVDSLRYSMEGDYDKVFIDPEGGCIVSAEDARLGDLLRIPSVAPLFGEPRTPDDCQGDHAAIPYADRFRPDTAIMCPALYHNIYKGALGEVAGRAILNNWGVQVDEIDDPEKFEKFDYVTTSGVYLDFKNWAGPGGIDNGALIKKTFLKLKAVGGSTAIIVNILRPKDHVGSDRGYTLIGSEKGYTVGDSEIPVTGPGGESADLEGLTVITVPYLYDCNGDETTENTVARETVIREVLS